MSPPSRPRLFKRAKISNKAPLRFCSNAKFINLPRSAADEILPPVVSCARYLLAVHARHGPVGLLFSYRLCGLLTAYARHGLLRAVAALYPLPALAALSASFNVRVLKFQSKIPI